MHCLSFADYSRWIYDIFSIISDKLLESIVAVVVITFVWLDKVSLFIIYDSKPAISFVIWFKVVWEEYEDMYWLKMGCEVMEEIESRDYLLLNAEELIENFTSISLAPSSSSGLYFRLNPLL